MKSKFQDLIRDFATLVAKTKSEKLTHDIVFRVHDDQMTISIQNFWDETGDTDITIDARDIENIDALVAWLGEIWLEEEGKIGVENIRLVLKVGTRADKETSHARTYRTQPPRPGTHRRHRPDRFLRGHDRRA